MPAPRTPLSRRILPWLFFALFLALAPLVILYTSGYRYNPKKAGFERNGTLIIDSTPGNARVFLDEQDTGEVSPVTFQNITPGWHMLKLVKEGYQPWEASVEARPERVTFANTIWLWKTATTTLAQTGSFIRVSASPADRLLAFLRQEEDGWFFSYTPSPSGISHDTLWKTPPPVIRWQPDGQSVLLGGLPTSPQTWWSKPFQPLAKTVDGIYHWSGEDLIGFTKNDRIKIDTRTGEQETAPESFDIVTPPSSTDRLLVNQAFPNRALSLPRGQWVIGDLRRSFVLLAEPSRWLAIQTRGDHPYSGELTGDYPRWHADTRHPMALFLNGGEIWLWKMGYHPLLLWRQSDPIIQVAWHPNGNNIFFADTSRLMALSLEQAQGRHLTTLTTFDRLFDFTVWEKTLFIAAIKNGTHGLWEMQVE